jgi:hypothetical protein
MMVARGETKTPKIKSQDQTTMTTNMVSEVLLFSHNLIAPKIPNGLKYNKMKKLYCIC